MQQQSIQEVYFTLGGMLLVSITLLALFMIIVSTKQTNIIVNAIECVQNQLLNNSNSFHRINSSIDSLTAMVSTASSESGKYLDVIYTKVTHPVVKSKKARLKFKKVVVESEMVPYPQKIPMLVIIDEAGSEQDYLIYDGLVYLLENQISVDKKELDDILSDFKVWMSSLD